MHKLIQKIKKWYFNRKYKKMIEEYKKMAYIQKYLEKNPRNNFNLADETMRLWKRGLKNGN